MVALRRLLMMAFVGGGIAYANSAAAQTVQLPTFQQFGIGTTVVVPDRGAVHLGGNRTAASSANQYGAFGVPLNRSAASQVGAAGMSISATIHDFDAMDRALLEEAARRRGRTQHGNESFSDLATQAPPPASVAEIRRSRAIPTIDPQADARHLIAQGDAAAAAGNLGAARVYYQMAARRTTGALQASALAKYDNLRRPTSVAAP